MKWLSFIRNKIVRNRSMCFFLSVLLVAGCLFGCGKATDGNKAKEGLKIVATIFPEYDWVKNILGERAEECELTLLLDNGIDLHNYQPTSEDILKISTCDLFLYVGGESDHWVKDTLAEATNQDMVVINLLEQLGESAKEEEIIEGMEAEEEGAEEEEEGPEYDEHVWLSLKNTSVLCDSIEKALETVDPDHADLYQANTKSYQEQLAALDEKYQDAADHAGTKTLLFGDRFPFRYLVDDYGLDYYAAFVGCSAETEASFETIIFLSQKLDELKLNSIMTIDGSDQKLAETIRDNTSTKDQKILSINSMQSATLEDAENGTTYLSIMEQNLDVLKEALAS